MPQLPFSIPSVGHRHGHDRTDRRSGLGDGVRSARPAELERGGFFDHPAYLRTVRAERTDAGSTDEALAAARLAGCKPGARILDAGCGNARHAVPLARAGYRVVAFDRSAPLLAAGRRAAGRAQWPIFVRGCYASLPFGTGRFDAVLSLGTAFGYLGDDGDQEALCEFRRVLAPGGRLVIETLHREQLDSGLAVHEDRQLPGGGTLRSDRRFDSALGVMHEAQRLRDDAGWGPTRTYEIRVYGIDELSSMLGHAGFLDTKLCRSLSGAAGPTSRTALVVVARA
jgi:SAM-dependent methyltransferase